MKIIAFGASNSKNSINKHFATYAASLFSATEVQIIDLNDYQMPLFSVDLEAEIGQHELAKVFLQTLSTADLLVVSMAEHNGNYSAAFKNIYDWCSRITPKVFHDKPMLLLATSPGARGGASVLEIAKNAFPRYGADVKATFSLPSFNDNFDLEKGVITNEELDTELRRLISLF
ncbi:MAG: NADPH-dependent FMN reductase [Flavobacterium sp.]